MTEKKSNTAVLVCATVNQDYGEGLKAKALTYNRKTRSLGYIIKCN